MTPYKPPFNPINRPWDLSRSIDLEEIYILVDLELRGAYLKANSCPDKLHVTPSCSGNKKKNYNNNNIGRFPGGGLENQNPARTIAHSPPGVKETLNYMLREK